MKRRVAESRRAPAAKKRPWCPTCGYTRFVAGPTVISKHGKPYSSVIDCPDCKEKPPVRLEPGQLPLDVQQRAAGERDE